MNNNNKSRIAAFKKISGAIDSLHVLDTYKK